MNINLSDRGVDFLYGQPAPAELAARNIRYAALYLKRWWPDYVASLHAAGIGVLPIVETVAGMMLSGATAGQQIATKAVADCRRYGIPEGTTIVFAHDTSIMTPAVVAFNVAAENVVRPLRYNYGGYGGRGYFDQCMAAGVRFDLIWATNARAWLGGRHPDAHAWQGTYGDGATGAYDTIDGVAVDKNVCTRPFTVWGPQAAPQPPSTQPVRGVDDMVIYTNSETRGGFAPDAWQYILAFDGETWTKYHNTNEALLDPSLPRIRRTNAQLDAIPDFAGMKVPTSTVHIASMSGDIGSVPGRVRLTVDP